MDEISSQPEILDQLKNEAKLMLSHQVKAHLTKEEVSQNASPRQYIEYIIYISILT